MTDTIREKPFILVLCKCLGVSVGKIRKDECSDYFVPSRVGKIYVCNESWYLYYTKDKRNWNLTKKKLSWMYLHQDGDDEGILRADFPPSPEQAVMIRKIMGWRKSYVPTHLGKK